MPKRARVYFRGSRLIVEAKDLLISLKLDRGQVLDLIKSAERKSLRRNRR